MIDNPRTLRIYISYSPSPHYHPQDIATTHMQNFFALTSTKHDYSDYTVETQSKRTTLVLASTFSNLHLCALVHYKIESKFFSCLYLVLLIVEHIITVLTFFMLLFILGNSLVQAILKSIDRRRLTVHLNQKTQFYLVQTVQDTLVL
jgi:hypothetical protein